MLSHSLKPVSLASWFKQLQIPPASLWTLLQGQVYSFNTSNYSGNAKGGQFFNGNVFSYEGLSKQQGWIPNSLARDAVGAWALQHNDCPEIVKLAKNPAALAAYLQAMPSDSSNTGCAVCLTRYKHDQLFWAAKLAAN